MTKGRKPKPTNSKVIQGTFRKDRHAGSEATPDPAIPPPPEHLNQVASVEWGRVSQELYNCGLLTRVDRAALAAYCVVYARWVEAEEGVREKGMIYKTPNGAVQQSPLVGIANRSLDIMHKYLVEFGMTPSSRSRIKVDPPKEADKNKFARHVK